MTESSLEYASAAEGMAEGAAHATATEVLGVECAADIVNAERRRIVQTTARELLAETAAGFRLLHRHRVAEYTAAAAERPVRLAEQSGRHPDAVRGDIQPGTAEPLPEPTIGIRLRAVDRHPMFSGQTSRPRRDGEPIDDST